MIIQLYKINYFEEALGMYHELKKSQITDWWIAPENSIMRFANVLSGQNLINGNFLVVGYLDKERRQLATSTNRVVRITEKGVMTAKGTFYPIEEAHELYLQFLIKANQPNTIIAFEWKYVSGSNDRKLVADIIEKGDVKKGVEFDFIPDGETSVILSGYSKDLSANVVLTTFNKRNVCIIFDMPEEDIYDSSFAIYEESMERIKEIKKIFSQNIQKSYISVMQVK